MDERWAFGDVFLPVVISELVCARIMGGANQMARYSINSILQGYFPSWYCLLWTLGDVFYSSESSHWPRVLRLSSDENRIEL
jgi:hypothetical protein